MGLINKFMGLFSSKKNRQEFSVEELRTTFKARYHQFKLLLNANDKALELMAQMEQALRGTHPFGMNFVRSRCTMVSTNVFQIIKNLNELAPGKYEELYARFKDIQIKVNPYLGSVGLTRDGALVLPLREVDKHLADQVGTKMANLGEIKNRMGLIVPGGFVITAQAYQRFMDHNDLQSEIDRLIQKTDAERLDQLYALSAAIQQLIIGSAVPEELQKAVLECYGALEKREGKGIKLAMRSSALGEDVAGLSFAGQYRTELNVSGENLFHAYREIVASKYGVPAMTYRLNRGIRDEDVAMCVGCLAMVDAVSSGVTYSRNPVNLRDDSIIINSVWGLPKSVVDGSAVSDSFFISRGDPMEIVRKEIRGKSQKFVCYPEEGVCRLDLTGEEGSLASLSDAQALELARLAVQLEEYHGSPQDIEWAIQEDGSIVLFQCRPLQQKEVQDVKDRPASPVEGTNKILLEGGVTGSLGAASGPVCMVQKDMDALKFPEGAILVTAQALPRWATLLNRAAAVISERGSIAGHLANVAREFGVPALFGVQGALAVLKDGQVVTVDAETTRVYDGHVENLVERPQTEKNLMEGSPVFDSLKGAAQHIILLNLLDPDSPAFRPQNCSTFHDITRFCHEKSVEEMFRFGKDHHFPERSSKQLVCEVPMQWWILNLDDGFREEVEGKYVQLENVISTPMLALWKGITAVPWEGPPPLDGKGFASVMFQATTNTALVPGLRSQYASRNYFMISKDYCSLNSRLGFHFSTVEALITDRPSENYISFQYKGGAADFERRLRRVLFIRDLLEEYAFRIEVKEDTLMARIEDHEKKFMKKRLEVLGYLTMHTRQLDMIMANETSVSHYKSKILEDLRKLVSTS